MPLPLFHEHQRHLKRGEALARAVEAAAIRGPGAPHFLLAPLVVAETDLALLLPARIARRYAGMLPIELLSPPLALEAFTLAQIWHERSHGDPAHQWRRQQIALAGRTGQDA